MSAEPRGEHKARFDAASSAGGKIGDIEVLRAFAIIFVLIEHIPLNLFPWYHTDAGLHFYFGFWSGVDLFFAISGFVIARSLLPMLDAATNKVEFFREAIAFWIRREWRLLPSAWLWLGIILAATLVFNRSHAFGTFAPNFAGAITAMLNIFNFHIMVAFGRYDIGIPISPYWSLSLEEQFYFLLPFIVLLSGRKLPYVLGFGVLAQLFVARVGDTVGNTGLILNQLRSDALFLGVLLAIWSRHETYRVFEPRVLRNRPWLSLASLFGLMTLLAAISSQFLHLVSFQVGVVAVLSAIIVFIASYDRDYLCPKGLFKRLMVWIGARSYAMYLIHIPAFCLTREIWFRHKPPGTVFDGTYTLRFGVTAVVLLLVLTELNYRFVEVPLRRRGARIAERMRLASSDHFSADDPTLVTTPSV